MTPRRGYALCTTPRSGSNFLCQWLTSTGVLGKPLEYFNGPARRSLGWGGYPDDPSLQLAMVLEAGATPNGCYGLKLFPSQADTAERWTTDLPGLRFVHLRREDLLGQALSWVRGQQTGQYRSTATPRAEPIYDPDRIQARLADIVRQEARWALFFARTGIKPLRLVYEAVAADPTAAVDAVARHMDVALGALEPATIDLIIQRDDLTETWRRRFLTERGASLEVDRL